MNSFAHAIEFLDQPYFAIGSCMPDWVRIVDRKMRAREKMALEHVADESPVVSELARGIVQHHQDDRQFHQSRTFNELSRQFSVELHEVLSEPGMRPGVIGHIIVEQFLDAFLDQQYPGILDHFYQQISAVDPEQIEELSLPLLTRPSKGLANQLRLFCQARYIFDYRTDQGTIYRLNRVLQRVGLRQMSPEILDWTPSARQRVYEQADRLYPRGTPKIAKK